MKEGFLDFVKRKKRTPRVASLDDYPPELGELMHEMQSGEIPFQQISMRVDEEGNVDTKLTDMPKLDE